jgi:hypothetical protein
MSCNIKKKKRKKKKKLSGFKVPSKSSGITQEKKNSLKEPIKVHPPSSIKGGKKKKPKGTQRGKRRDIRETP